jgi:hypothetical protein
MSELHDSSLLMLVGDLPGKKAGVPTPEGEDPQAERARMMDYMKQVCLGYERAPNHVVAAIDAALAVCQEWQSRPRGKNVPFPPPALRKDPKASEDASRDYQPSLKSIAYTPCLPEPPSVLAMMAVRKVNNQAEDSP